MHCHHEDSAITAIVSQLNSTVRTFLRRGAVYRDEHLHSKSAQA